MTRGGTLAAIGVDVAGFLRGGLGLGEAARRYVTALEAAEVPVRTTSVDVFLPEDAAATAARRPSSRTWAPTTTSPLQPRLRQRARAAALLQRRRARASSPASARSASGRGRSTGCPRTGPGPSARSTRSGPTPQYVVDVLRPASNVPVARVPLPVSSRPSPARRPTSACPTGSPSCSCSTSTRRSSARTRSGLIEAFRRAFRPGEGPQLVLKSFNGDLKPERLEQVREAAAGHPDIHVVDRYVTAAERDALVAGCDCFVSLHRAEGFGLGLAEAMALGRPVIATGFSGNVDFMTPENSWLVRSTMTEVGREGENYPSEGRWAEPDIEHAAELMREVWENPRPRASAPSAGRRDVLEQLSPANVGALARERLRAPGDRRRAAARSEPPPPPPAHDHLGAAAPGAAASSTSTRSPTRRRRAAPRAPRAQAALRAMRPYTHHQEELNKAAGGGGERPGRAVRGAGAGVGPGRRRARPRSARLIEAARARPVADHPLISRDGTASAVLAFTRRSRAESTRTRLPRIRGRLPRRRGAHPRAARRSTSRCSRAPTGCSTSAAGGASSWTCCATRGRPRAGVDLDAAMVARCREKGHEVEQADALEYLGRLDDGSLPGAFAAQVIEHLPADVLNDFLRALAAKLRPGGVAVLETVNPHLPSALKAFWVDPTHHHPLFPEVTLALGPLRGLSRGPRDVPGRQRRLRVRPLHEPGLRGGPRPLRLRPGNAGG